MDVACNFNLAKYLQYQSKISRIKKYFLKMHDSKLWYASNAEFEVKVGNCNRIKAFFCAVLCLAALKI